MVTCRDEALCFAMQALIRLAQVDMLHYIALYELQGRFLLSTQPSSCFCKADIRESHALYIHRMIEQDFGHSSMIEVQRI